MLSDPQSASAKIRRAASRVSTRVRRLLRGTTQAPSTSATRRPVIDYRREMTRASDRRALLAYLVEPFHHPPEVSLQQDYSNWTMSLEIANALNRLGFAVDVINYDDYDFRPVRDYDVFVGMTANFSRLLPLIEGHTRTVYWATRPDPAFEMEAIRQRQLALFQRRHVWVPTPDALMPLLESADYYRADALILIGNAVVRSTFRTLASQVHCIDNPALPIADHGRPGRDLTMAGKHFLFLSSWLLVRKGLDLVLEVFARRPDLTLWICGPVDSEAGFAAAYRTELFHTSNIRALGWLPMQSPAFAEVSARCAYLVFPSCAEGMSGSVLNGMAHGLVPICTAESGVDLEDFGIHIPDSTPEGLGRAIDLAASLPLAELRRRGDAARNAIAQRYSVTHFRAQIEAALASSVAGLRSGNS